jgi:phenylalanyl-tRNA synthetase beta chain
MKYLKSWLQDYIVDTLPENEVIAEALNKKAFEVEDIICIIGDTVFDIKVLPNRAHDALGHRGMAREICADLGYTFKDDKRITKNYKVNGTFYDTTVETPHVVIGDEKACTRFMSMRIDNVSVSESPKWLKDRLAALDKRSINNIVDATNYVQFSLNKPMHAYDARSVQGAITARFARAQETLTTLDDKELKLTTKTLVIADDEKVLGLAGVKGGKFSGVMSDTTSIILESANFMPTLIRTTAQEYDIRTDASKRFENGITNSLVEEGLYMTANIIKELCAEAKASDVVDVYPKHDEPFVLRVARNDINAVLGTEYTDKAIQETFSRLSFTFTVAADGVYDIVVPVERLDIRIKEDIAEEVGRIIGYDALTPVLPQLTRRGLLNKRMHYENKVRELLIAQGFSEIMTYTFGDEGEVNLVKGLADDKEKLRKSLGKGVLTSFSLNLHNAPLLGQNIIKLFEIGNVFTHDKESRHLAIALDDGAKKSSFVEQADMLLASIKRTLNVTSLEYATVSTKPYVIEIDFDTLIASLPEPRTYETPSFASLPVVTYTSVSPYPFIARDIAMWVSDSTTWESIRTLCTQVGNALVTRIDLFDTFEKSVEGIKKTSYAFRLVFQSKEKTLTDEDVNTMMEPYYQALKAKGYEIR